MIHGQVSITDISDYLILVDNVRPYNYRHRALHQAEIAIPRSDPPGSHRLGGGSSELRSLSRAPHIDLSVSLVQLLGVLQGSDGAAASGGCKNS